MRSLLLATTNQHKVEELRTIFADLPWQLLSLNDLHIDMDVEETGTTFQENSELKARAYAQAAGMLVLAEDSGLEIDALNGEPGVYSARFLGADTPYAQRFNYILAHMRHVLPPERRTARFHSVITLAEPSGYHRSVEGVIEGIIADEPRGNNGFGYDPIFFVPAFGMTTAEMLAEQKNSISHRGLAALKARKLLEGWPQSPPSHA